MKYLGISMGDAAGVGPEILVRAAAEGTLGSPYVVFGDLLVLEFAAETLGVQLDLNPVKQIEDCDPNACNVIDLSFLQKGDFAPGELSSKCGEAAVRYVEAATRAALDGKTRGIVTLPINKAATRATRPDFEGHTELIAGMCGVSDYTMMLYSERLVVTHVSTHVSLIEAIRRVQSDRIQTVITLTHQALVPLFSRPPKIAVAGLNPHASENGAFGSEEAREIEPAVKRAKAAGIDASGPHPADTIFMQAVSGKYDAVVCMYHDQGHIPAKLSGFSDAVNVTIGLPIVRTSVDHGTAFDIAYQGKADLGSFYKAFELADKMSRHH